MHTIEAYANLAKNQLRNSIMPETYIEELIINIKSGLDKALALPERIAAFSIAMEMLNEIALGNSGVLQILSELSVTDITSPLQDNSG
jgi:hypothetical protein